MTVQKTRHKRAHEWARGYVRRRTVCGLTSEAALRNAVSDLGNMDPASRCQNCDRMRAAIGTSSKPAEPEPVVPAGAGELTEREREIIEHATGWLTRSPLYRNHYCAGEGHAAWDTIQGLIKRGLMRVSREPDPITGGDTVFCATAIGIASLKRRKDAPKPTEAEQG